MNSTKLYAFSNYSFPEPVMPVDLAMHTQTSPPMSPLLSLSMLNLSKSSQLGMSSQDFQSARSTTPSPTSSLSSYSSSSSLSSYSPSRNTPRKKKRVVFADAKGLSLTAVRIFTSDPSETEPEDAPQPEEKVKARQTVPIGKLRLKLGFHLHGADRASLRESLVQLESCTVTEKALCGTVRVCNVKFDKSVFIRITFDSWRSHQDIACTYIWEPLSSVETDLFTFNVPLPSELDLKERVEFIVVFQPGNNNVQLVDNNKGTNYRIYAENPTPEPRMHQTSSRRSFVIPSPQRFSAWQGVRGHEAPKMNNMACKSPSSYTERLLNKTWVRIPNVAPLC